MIMACVPSKQTIDLVNATRHSRIIVPHQQFIEWLDEISSHILATSRSEFVLLPKTPSQKARGFARPKPQAAINLTSLEASSIRATRYATRCKKKLDFVAAQPTETRIDEVELELELEKSEADTEHPPAIKEKSPKQFNMNRAHFQSYSTNIQDPPTTSALNEKNSQGEDAKSSKRIPKRSKSSKDNKKLKAEDKIDSAYSPYMAKKGRFSDSDEEAAGKISKERSRSHRSLKVSRNLKRMSTCRTICGASKRKSSLAKHKNVLHTVAKVSLVKEALASLTLSKPLLVDQSETSRNNDQSEETSKNNDQSESLAIVDAVIDTVGPDEKPEISQYNRERHDNEIPDIVDEYVAIPDLYVQEIDAVEAKCLRNVSGEHTVPSSKLLDNEDKLASIASTSGAYGPMAPNVAPPFSPTIFRHNKDNMKTYSKIPLFPSTNKFSRPAAQIVVSSPSRLQQEVRTTRSKARQKIQNESDTKEKVNEKTNKMANIKTGPSLLNVAHSTTSASTTSSSSGMSLLSSASGQKTPSILLKTDKYFNTLATINNGMKVKTPNAPSTSLFNSLFSMSSHKPALANLAGSNVSSFIKRNTPIKMDQKELEAQQLEKLKQQDVKRQEASQKKNEFLKVKAEENRRKREERNHKVAAMRKQLEEKNKRKMEDKMALKEQETKKLQQQKLAEQEARDKAEKEREKLRLKKEEQERIAADCTAAAAKASTMASAPNQKFVASNNPKVLKLKERSTKVIESYDLTPTTKKKKPLLQKNNDYGIEELDSGDETDDADSPKKQIPPWAQGDTMKGALVEQYYTTVDTLELFGLMEKPDLKKIFNDDKNRYKIRTSSAHWPDESFFPFAEDN